jgi:hypothetical protein
MGWIWAPLGDCLPTHWAVFWKNAEVDKYLAHQDGSYALIFAKNRLGHTLGDIFTNASGHPDYNGKSLYVLIRGTLEVIRVARWYI